MSDADDDRTVTFDIPMSPVYSTRRVAAPVELKTVSDLAGALAGLDGGALPVYIEQGRGVMIEETGGGVKLSPFKTGPAPPPPQSVRFPFGFYALQPGSETPSKGDPPTKRKISEAQMRLPSIAGLTIRVRPPWIVSGDKWDFSFIDTCVALCRKVAKPYTLLLMGGGKNPTGAENMNFYVKAAGALGDRYADDPLCVGAHITGCSPTGVSEELHWDGGMKPDVVACNKRLGLAWAEAFPHSTIILAGSLKDAAHSIEIAQHVRAAAGDRVMLKHNSLKSSTSLTAAHNKMLVTAAKAGLMIGFEMVGPGENMKAVDMGKKVAAAGGYTPTRLYIAVYPEDLSKVDASKL